MNVSKTPQGSWITILASGPPVAAVMPSVPPNTTTPPMGQPPKLPTPSENEIAKRNQVNFVKQPQFQKKKRIFLPKKGFLVEYEFFSIFFQNNINKKLTMKKIGEILNWSKYWFSFLSKNAFLKIF